MEQPEQPVNLDAQKQKIFDFIRTRGPTYPMKIAENFKWSSPNTAKDHMDLIFKKGEIELNEVGKYRRTRVIKLKEK